MGAKGKYEIQFLQRVKEPLGFFSDYTVLGACIVTLKQVQIFLNRC